MYFLNVEVKGLNRLRFIFLNYIVSGNDRLQDAERGSTTIEEGECEETLGQRNESAMKYTPPQESPRRRLPGSQASSVQSSPRRFPPGSQASSVQSSPSRFDNLKDKMKSECGVYLPSYSIVSYGYRVLCYVIPSGTAECVLKWGWTRTCKHS